MIKILTSCILSHTWTKYSGGKLESVTVGFWDSSYIYFRRTVDRRLQVFTRKSGLTNIKNISHDLCRFLRLNGEKWLIYFDFLRTFYQTSNQSKRWNLVLPFWLVNWKKQIIKLLHIYLNLGYYMGFLSLPDFSNINFSLDS